MKVKQNISRLLALICAFAIPAFGGSTYSYYSKTAAIPPQDTPEMHSGDKGNFALPAFILVSKEDMTLKVISTCSETLFSSDITCGREFGNKISARDERTPEGVFSVNSIERSSGWMHRNKDNGKLEKGCYGDWFIRLDTPQTESIGIHGTNKPEEIGKRTSEGCVRLRNEDINELVELCYVGMPVIITAGAQDFAIKRQKKFDN